MECFLIDKIHRESQTFEHSLYNEIKLGTRDHNNQHQSKVTNSNPRKYCKFHNSRTQNTQECRIYNKENNTKKKNEKEHKPDSKSYSINEPKPQPKAIEIPLSINENEYEALVDTGSIENYLPENIIKNQKIPTTKIKPTKITEIADGSLVEIDSYSKVIFKIFNDINNIYKSKFYVIPNPNGQPILGMRFLLENNSVIDLSENTLNIDGVEYEIDCGGSSFNSFDQEIILKSKIYKMKNADEKINELIQKFKKQNPKLGNIKKYEHSIELFDDFKLNKKEYSVPLGLQKEVKDHLDGLINDGVIKECFSKYISQTFVIRKKNGKIRLFVDYRYLNSITKKTHQFTPNMFEILAKLKRFTIFSSIDLNQGYYQVKVAKGDIEKTGFKILNRTFVFQKMSFGLCNAPATFQRIMNEILK
ncbi:Retrovirus-related Pol polyprotein from transposon 17.6 [Dictyocoela roeselum]|nr:Retrovirus-related Pol polyprotein from transposon 17.6 [Dictyocoela roeselum]